ncbi:unnamed protein product [Rotaria sp. Silwood2]|nr:unnamed protein product [Rotaria sp. Silwood2]
MTVNQQVNNQNRASCPSVHTQKIGGPRKHAENQLLVPVQPRRQPQQRQRQQQRPRQRQQQRPQQQLQLATFVSSFTLYACISNPISEPRCVYFKGNNTIYLCGHQVGYIEAWVVNAASRTVVTSNTVDHTDYITFDKDGTMYTNDHNSDLVKSFVSNSLTGTTIAGSGSSVSGTLNRPTGTAVNENLTLYIADRDNDRVVKLDKNATSIVTVINTNGVISKPSALLLKSSSSDQIYISDESGQGVYLWTFGATTPSKTLTSVNCNSTLNSPRGIKLDTDGNLYVADQDNKRVVMFCVNSTEGNVILRFNDKPMDIALDPNLNLYVLLDTGKLYKHQLL